MGFMVNSWSWPDLGEEIRGKPASGQARAANELGEAGRLAGGRAAAREQGGRHGDRLHGITQGYCRVQWHEDVGSTSRALQAVDSRPADVTSIGSGTSRTHITCSSGAGIAVPGAYTPRVARCS